MPIAMAVIAAADAIAPDVYSALLVIFRPANGRTTPIATTTIFLVDKAIVPDQ